MAQGELQGALSNLGTVVRVLTPLIWGWIYTFGLSVGQPSLIYFCSAAAGIVQVYLARAIFAVLIFNIPASIPASRQTALT